MTKTFRSLLDMPDSVAGLNENVTVVEPIQTAKVKSDQVTKDCAETGGTEDR